MKPGRLEILGLRSLAEYDRVKGLHLVVAKNAAVTIEVARDPAQSDTASVNRVISEIFLGPDDRLEDLLPAYWRGCLPENLTDFKGEKRCSGLPQLPRGPDGQKEPVLDEHSGAYRSGHAVSEPKIQFHENPTYTEEARALTFKCTVLLRAVVGDDGRAHDIRIERPCGLGLDEAAVQSWEAATFTPAKLNAKPVRVLVEFETSFKITK